MGSLLVDAHWHAFCQALYQGMEGQEWEALYYHYHELHQAVKSSKLGENQQARALSVMKAAKDREEEFYDPKLQRHSRDKIRLGLSETHF